MEAGAATADEWKGLIRQQAGSLSFDPDTRRYCMIIVLAPWRDTSGPTWQLVASMPVNQRRELEESQPPGFMWVCLALKSRSEGERFRQFVTTRSITSPKTYRA